MANRISASASPSPSNGRPISAVLADDCTLDTVSSTGARVSKHSPRASVSRTERLRRRESPRTLKSQRLSASQQLATYAALSGLSQGKTITAGIATGTGEPGVSDVFGDARPELRRFYSDPNTLANSNAQATREDGNRMEVDSTPVHTKEGGLIHEQNSISRDVAPTNTQINDHREMFKQPETNPITEEQLVNEVRGIYAGLVMVEKKCIEIDKQQTESKAELSAAEWQALISLHRTLLYEHHDFFLASQHPSASPVLKRLAEKYAMPARMWRYGIHSFLEVLRQRLPGSLEYMLNFIYLAYSMMTLLYESVAAFRDTWIECLGDLARYRMAVEEFDLRDRETWAGVSRYWYSQDADRSPDVGRIQHHLAVLARPDVLQQLFYYTKALVCVRPFPNARESAMMLLNPYNTQLLHQHSMVTAFLATHGVLFTQGPTEQFVTRANHFLSLFRWEIRRLSRQGQQGAHIMSVNFASVLQYGQPEVVMALGLSPKQGETAAEAYTFALNSFVRQSAFSPSENQTTHVGNDSSSTSSQLPFQIPYQGSCLSFHTLAILLEQMGDPNVYPGVHTALAFLWCLSLRPEAMRQVERLVPWLGLTKFLNTLFRTDTNFQMIERNEFPQSSDTSQQLSEDFLIRGQVWSQLLYPEKFFEGAPSEDDRPLIEEQSTIAFRRHRCLWLGVRIATVSYKIILGQMHA